MIADDIKLKSKAQQVPVITGEVVEIAPGTLVPAKVTPKGRRVVHRGVAMEGIFL